MTTFTGGGITLYRWAVIRQSILLEMKGLRSRHFAAARRRLCDELGLGPRAKLAAMLEKVEEKLKDAEANLKEGEIEP